jgi:glycosyltransferase involved in cell wall biosynthesis
VTSHQPLDRRPRPRLAWFSPVPPSTSGIAAYTADVVPALRARGLDIDVFADDAAGCSPGLDAINARDFVWMHRRQPYDLPVYQLGNARCHDFMWGYLFRHPGLLVLHDAQVHQARAQGLLQRYVPRRDDYLAEFAASHPDAPPDIAHLVAAGLGGSLYAHWPHIRLVLQAARLAAVHSAPLARRLTEAYGVDVDAIPMGVPDPLTPPPRVTPVEIRTRHDVPTDAVLVGAFGGVTPEKRLPELLRAMATASSTPPLHLLVVGAPAAHYDVLDDARAAGVAARVHVTGFVPDDELGAYLAAVDICACMRWPSNGETSASWWRAMAAGRATIVTDLTHQCDLPVVDPRGWRLLGASGVAPVAVAIPVLDELPALTSALDTLARSPSTRRAIGMAARAAWEDAHTVTAMVTAYVALVGRALARTAPTVRLPPHLTDTGDRVLNDVLESLGASAPDIVKARRV